MGLEKWLFDGCNGIDVGVMVTTLVAMENLPPRWQGLNFWSNQTQKTILATVLHTHVVGHRYHDETLTHEAPLPAELNHYSNLFGSSQ